MEKLRVAIADDHPAIRKGVRTVLERMPDVIVVGEAENGQKAIEVVETAAPEMLILDISMPVLDGIDVLNILSERDKDLRIVVFSAIDDPVFKEEALSLGACYFLTKTEVRQLIQIVRKIIDGEYPCKSK